MTSEPEEPLPAPCLVVVTERETVSDGEGSLPPPPDVQPCSDALSLAGGQGSASLTRLKATGPASRPSMDIPVSIHDRGQMPPQCPSSSPARALGDRRPHLQVP